jgi:hypothetical protein
MHFPALNGRIICVLRAAMVDFWQARMLQWRPHHQCGATAAAVFFFAKSRQDSGLASLTSCNSPNSDHDFDLKNVVKDHKNLQVKLAMI